MLVWDAHSCLPLDPKADIGLLSPHQEAGVDVVSINVGMDFNPLSQIIAVIASFRKQISKSKTLCQVNSVDSLFFAKENGKLAVLFDLEGAVPLMDSPAMVQLFFDLGVRQIHLAYNRNNSVAGGCHDSPQGLTALGKEMVAEINSVGMIMDVSHCSPQTVFDVCAVSKKPVVFSHSNMKELVDHPRNIGSDQIAACVETGGVICINGVHRFLGGGHWSFALKHLMYLLDKAGPDHVGLGLDVMLTQAGIDDMPSGVDPAYWWPTEFYPSGLDTLGYLQPNDIVNLRTGLLSEGVTEAELAKIMGGNMLRVASETWP